jgi:glycosyltransferase involved in cell wall biosynthesis
LVEQYRSRKTITVHNGIELRPRNSVERVEKRRELGLPLDKKIVCTVGRLMPVKGLGHLLRAAQRLVAVRDDVVFAIVGDGPLKGELLRMVRELGIEQRVFFLGFRRDVREVLSSADAFVLTSLHEGIPMSLLEAMSIGLPAVATRVGGIPEVIEDGSSGFLVTPGDEEAIAAAIVAALSESGREISIHGRERVQREFSLTGMAAHTDRIYRSLLGFGESRES